MSETAQQNGLVPKLRFPEFRKAAASVVDLRAIAMLSTETVELKSLDPKTYVSTESLLPDFGGFGAAAGLPSTTTVRGYKVGDVLVSNIRPYLKKVWYADRSGGASNDVLVFRGKDDVLSDFLAQIIASNAFISHMMKGAKGVKMPRGDGENVLAFRTILPDKAEQRKIADCLQSLDELIAAQTEKLEGLKRHKKGLLQQLFPAEGETTPRLRFPQFQDAPVWQRHPLRELLSEAPRYGLNAPATEYDERLPLYLRITDIDEGGGYTREGRVSVAEPVSEDDYLQVHDIAVARTGASVGKSYYCDGSDGPFVYAGFLIRLRADSKKLLPALLAQWMRTDEYWDWVTLTCARSGQPGINGTEYAGVRVPIPSGVSGTEEQSQIAAYLSGTDRLIHSIKSIIAALRVHKSGLMQQLLPTIEEDGNAPIR